MAETLYFEEIKEPRDGYFVEYHPPIADARFATMNLVFVRDADVDAVSKAMLCELSAWLKRFDVPIMMSAWDAREKQINPGAGETSFLVGWQASPGKVIHSWRYADLDVFLAAQPKQVDWRTIYKDVPFKTDVQVKANAETFINERRRQNRNLKAILFGWLAVIPAGIALFQYFGPEWLGLLALIFGLWKAGRAGYRLWRNSKPTPSEAAKAEKQRKMDHYFYHCERNPGGFARLTVENSERESADRIRKEAEALALKGGSGNA
ncbi:hypothetical protein BH10PSE6_BH10PSE6_35210 [soil metagenome]